MRKIIGWILAGLFFIGINAIIIALRNPVYTIAEICVILVIMWAALFLIGAILYLIVVLIIG